MAYSNIIVNKKFHCDSCPLAHNKPRRLKELTSKCAVGMVLYDFGSVLHSLVTPEDLFMQSTRVIFAVLVEVE